MIDDTPPPPPTDEIPSQRKVEHAQAMLEAALEMVEWERKRRKERPALPDDPAILEQMLVDAWRECDKWRSDYYDMQYGKSVFRLHAERLKIEMDRYEYLVRRIKQDLPEPDPRRWALSL
jgi:hypothetical protein